MPLIGVFVTDVLGSSASSDMVTQPLPANQQQSVIDQLEPKPEPEPEFKPNLTPLVSTGEASSANSVHSPVLLLVALISFSLRF